MIKSMTGFGRAEAQDEQHKFTVEIKSVNHRYLDFNIKMPKKLSFFDSAIRTLLKAYMLRGKVDIFISYEDFTQSHMILQYNQDVASQYMAYFKKMADTFGICNDITAAELGRFQDVFTMEEVDSDEKELWGLLEQVLRKACEQFVETRKTEGENLRTDLLQKLDQMFEKVGMVEERSPQILQEYRQKLEDKMKELLSDTQIEESRIASEVIIYADKICTDEETVRLKSHIRHMKEVLADGEGIGRKLDFIAQEMNREANTILSKANDLETSNLAIDLKTEIEKVREQIQNIE